ncbi:hypothetical protein EHV15_35690 [Paenibacillus oralis]|uniref:Uncharacterized protein n=1 Tax=Paenibacillus oralis TaxID=2490856 RepID=A0A3P3TA53_9BACL|nr:hypothetical protein [Paenibacillus oralis]RRJ54916.1 hypothetical protein EHV15_35690 [Paenibacillus oralis]
MFKKIDEYLNSIITFDAYLRTLNRGFQADCWESGTGRIKFISDEKYQELKKLTNIMTTEELRNPHLISDERIRELATLSNVNHDEIKIHFFDFELSYRIKHPKKLDGKSLDEQMKYYKNIAEERGILKISRRHSTKKFE